MLIMTGPPHISSFNTLAINESVRHFNGTISAGEEEVADICFMPATEGNHLCSQRGVTSRFSLPVDDLAS